MPRFVDPDQRKAEIVSAVIELLSDGGFKNFTVRALAQKMGGSSTLVTHYFPTRDDLLVALHNYVLKDAEDQRGRLLEIDDPQERLHAVLAYFLPDDLRALNLERVRIAMAANRDSEPLVADFFSQLEPGMRGLIRASLEEFIPPEDLDSMVDLLRVWTSGMAVSAVEHPEIWTPERQRATLKLFVSSLPINFSKSKARRRRATTT